MSAAIRRGERWSIRALQLLLLVVAASCVALPGGADSHEHAAGTIRVGVASVEITPTEPIRLTGYPDRRLPTDSVAQRLWARALAFQDGDTGLSVMVTADLIAVPESITEPLAERLAGAGVERPQLVVTATHTHNGPSLSGVLPFIFGEPVPAEHQAVIDRYTGELLDRLEQVALLAIADLRPARVAWGQGEAGFAVNRRVLRDGRWVGFGAVPDAPADHDLPVLTVRELDGALRAVLVGYATHCTTLVGQDNFIHGDWAGAVQEMIAERYPGAVALVLIGAGADSDPQPRGNGIADVDRHGREIANEIDRLLGGELRPITRAPTGRFQPIELGFERVPGRGELAEQAEQPGAPGLFARSMLAHLGHGGEIPGSARYPVQSWSFGDELAMVFLGGEVVVDYSLRLKRELDATRLWVTAYANDVAFYVPSRRILEEGGYEADGSMVFYGQPSRLAADTEDRIVTSVHDLVGAAFGGTAALVRGGALAERHE